MNRMIGFIVLLLVIWLVLAVLGFVIKGLFWLAVIGIILFVVTGIVGYIRRGGSRSKA
ncbi:apolipoprotein N-acyltransferase [Frigoribacterium sp. UYMn621]